MDDYYGPIGTPYSLFVYSRYIYELWMAKIHLNCVVILFQTLMGKPVLCWNANFLMVDRWDLCYGQTRSLFPILFIISVRYWTSDHMVQIHVAGSSSDLLSSTEYNAHVVCLPSDLFCRFVCKKCTCSISYPSFAVRLFSTHGWDFVSYILVEDCLIIVLCFKVRCFYSYVLNRFDMLSHEFYMPNSIDHILTESNFY